MPNINDSKLGKAAKSQGPFTLPPSELAYNMAAYSKRYLNADNFFHTEELCCLFVSRSID